MAYKICKKCQRFFSENGKSYCDECDEKLNVSHSKIKEYLEEFPNSSILEIVNNTGVKLKDVNIFLAEGGATYSEVFNENISLNLREEEINKEIDKFNKKERAKIRNKFVPRSLRR
ncbi:putative flagellar protein [Gottschalkia acidurici 9a]|uniref:Flagellar protein n=1 Tax=Gottschalkia acidurici (strain ATCC 7906 / DSM 604 / BCRC 14475 / CIP 104303 / KCTC 5404 / NCIMB 10678 / 9a) TaxID=1128398 RepID=K0AX27_GOTA9|nr:flagellar protein [Gottschalkia acidurici]AFS77332.1 putative flagellar protein [Gottschalkia acidurici 9a]